jgi:hypothetical protein
MFRTGLILKILESDSGRYQMFSDEGNEACDSLSKKVCKQIMDGELSLDETITGIKKGIDKIDKDHPEVHDTEPRAQFRYEIREAFRQIGLEPDDFWF